MNQLRTGGPMGGPTFPDANHGAGKKHDWVILDKGNSWDSYSSTMVR